MTKNVLEVAMERAKRLKDLQPFLHSPTEAQLVAMSDEIKQLRGNLSLAEEGLANAMQEIQRKDTALTETHDAWSAETQRRVQAEAQVERLQTLLIRVLEDGDPSQDLLQEIEEAVTRHADEPGECHFLDIQAGVSASGVGGEIEIDEGTAEKSGASQS